MKYDSSTLHPPGPMLDVTVWPVGHANPTRLLPGKPDAGADISIIPPSLADDLQLIPEDSVVMVSYDGAETERTVYFVNLEIAGYKLECIEVVAAPRDNVLLGRDVLNQFNVTLRGKELTFEIVDP